MYPQAHQWRLLCRSHSAGRHCPQREKSPTQYSARVDSVDAVTADNAAASSTGAQATEPFDQVPAGRGGPQRIPRPEGTTLGGPAPWAHIPESQRRVTLADISRALGCHRPAQSVGTVGEGIGCSAVLCLLYERADDVYMILTRRSPRMRHHAHEVAFPGGRREATDADLWTTALREAQEEVGVDPSTIRRIGELDSFVTVGSRTLVTPFVAVADQEPTLRRDQIEVELIRHVGFRELLSDEAWREEFWPLPQRPSGLPRNHRPKPTVSEAVARAAHERNEQERQGPAYKPRAITFFELNGDTVWGATAAILRQLLSIATAVDGTAVTANANVDDTPKVDDTPNADDTPKVEVVVG